MTPPDANDQAPSARGLYAATRTVGALVFVSGQLPFVNDELTVTGRVGFDVDLVRAKAQAALAARNVLRTLSTAFDLSAVRAVEMIAFVASEASFVEQHLVANAASQVLLDELGPRGTHTRTAVAVPCLPLNAVVELRCVFEHGAA